MKGVITDAPRDHAVVGGGATWIGLTFNAEIHDVVTTDGAVIDFDIPSPHGDG